MKIFKNTIGFHDDKEFQQQKMATLEEGSVLFSSRRFVWTDGRLSPTDFNFTSKINKHSEVETKNETKIQSDRFCWPWITFVCDDGDGDGDELNTIINIAKSYHSIPCFGFALLSYALPYLQTELNHDISLLFSSQKSESSLGFCFVLGLFVFRNITQKFISWFLLSEIPIFFLSWRPSKIQVTLYFNGILCCTCWFDVLLPSAGNLILDYDWFFVFFFMDFIEDWTGAMRSSN